MEGTTAPRSSCCEPLIDTKGKGKEKPVKCKGCGVRSTHTSESKLLPTRTSDNQPQYDFTDDIWLCNTCNHAQSLLPPGMVGNPNLIRPLCVLQ